MTGRVRKEHIILYLCISIGYLIHWVHNDLEYHPGNFAASVTNNLWQLVYIVGANLLYFESVLPYVTARKNHRAVLIVSSVVVHLVVFTTGLFLWRELGRSFNLYQPLTGYTTASKAFSDSVRFAPGPFLVFAVFKLFFDYTRLRFESQQVRLEKKQAELLFLKSQINPHFLFNTLNNIYSLSQYQPALVSESVLRLSKILRYILYEANHEFMTIEKEIKILNDYIDLERLRYNESVSIKLTHEIDDFSERIPPLLLIPLVENAFKHGVSVSRGKRFADVTCRLANHRLHFVVRNSVGSPGAPPHGEDERENIGLANLRKRLGLLYTDYTFATEQKDSTFTADLKVNLLSHV